VRYLMCVFPFFIALLACGLPNGKLARLVCMVAVCAVMVVSDVNYHFDPKYARENVRDAVAIIGERSCRDLMVVPAVGQTLSITITARTP